MQIVPYSTCIWFKPEGRVLCCCNVSFFAKNRDSATMAVVPLLINGPSQVAVLLLVGEARTMRLCILKADGQKNGHTPFKSFQTSISHKINVLDLGSANIRFTICTKSNKVPDPIPMPIKYGLSHREAKLCPRPNGLSPLETKVAAAE